MYTHSYSFNTDICLHIHSAECTVRLLNQPDRNNYPYNPKYVGNTGNKLYIINISINFYNKILIIFEGTFKIKKKKL